jgi:hypothetical protein
MPPAPISPNNRIINPKSIEISRFSAPSPDVSLGEILSATVMEKSAGGKYLLALKNLCIPATSTIPLNAGETLIVKVNSLQPQIVLNIVDGPKQSGEAIVNEQLRQWWANPESLLQVINKVAEFARLIQTEDLPLTLPPKDIDKLIKLFESIIFSPRTGKNSLFLPEFISGTGLLLESTLKQLVAEAAKGMMDKPLEDNLKTLLLKLSAAVREALHENSKTDSPITAKLINISAFTDEALKSIETRQVLNTVYQDSDNGLALQIPLALGGGFRLADIFITREKKDGQEKKKSSSGSIVIFLDLDILGRIMISASVREGGFSCVIKCAREEGRDLIAGKLDELKGSIVATGYRVDYIDCVQEEELMRKREDFLASQFFSVIDLVNFFV